MMRNQIFLTSLRRYTLPSAEYLRFCSGAPRPDTKAAIYTPNALEKYLLVWIKKYPSVQDVPQRVSKDEIERVRDWARIKINIGACVATALACIYMVKIGKDAAKRGESVQKMNLDWHKEQNKK